MRQKILLTLVSALFMALPLVGLSTSVTATGDNHTEDKQTLACGVNTVEIPETVVEGEEGDTTKLRELTVPSNLQGKTVAASAKFTNNESVHPDTTIKVVSDATSLTLNDVEGSANKVTEASGQLTLGSTVDVTVTLGEDGVFSGGGEVIVTVNCPPEGGQGGGEVQAAQAEAPVGSVKAGEGGESQIKLSYFLGLIGSLSLAGIGFGLLRDIS